MPMMASMITHNLSDEVIKVKNAVPRPHAGATGSHALAAWMSPPHARLSFEGSSNGKMQKSSKI